MEQNNGLFGLQKARFKPCLRPTLPQRYAFSLCFGLFIYLLTKHVGVGLVFWKQRKQQNMGNPKGPYVAEQD